MTADSPSPAKLSDEQIAEIASSPEELRATVMKALG